MQKAKNTAQYRRSNHSGDHSVDHGVKREPHAVGCGHTRQIDTVRSLMRHGQLESSLATWVEVLVEVLRRAQPEAKETGKAAPPGAYRQGVSCATIGARALDFGSLFQTRVIQPTLPQLHSSCFAAATHRTTRRNAQGTARETKHRE